MKEIYKYFYDDMRAAVEAEVRDYLFNKKKRTPKILFDGESLDGGEPMYWMRSYSQEKIHHIANSSLPAL